jgi:hypothetical protein
VNCDNNTQHLKNVRTNLSFFLATVDSMGDQPPLNDALLGDSSKHMHEISREEILKQIFGDIGELADGKLMPGIYCKGSPDDGVSPTAFYLDFTCAVESTVLLHGRMYITNRFICFYSNLFGLEKKIRIPYSHIRSITKENTAMVIPNAIAISTGQMWRDHISENVGPERFLIEFATLSR